MALLAAAICSTVVLMMQVVDMDVVVV